MNKKFDVILVGAGMAGLGTALGLAALKKKVLVISRSGLKGESSPAAGGILDPLLEMKPGSFFFPFCMKAFRAWPSDIKKLEKQAGQKTGYRACGMLYAALSEKDEKILNGRWKWQKKSGVRVQKLNRPQILNKEKLFSKNVRSGLFYPEIGRVQPRRLLKVMTNAAKKAGVKFVLANSPAQIKIHNGRAAGVMAGGDFYAAPAVVNAMGSWAGPTVPVKPARGQILILKKNNLKIRNILHTVDGGYIVPWDPGTLLVGSTVEMAGFKPKVTAAGRKLVRAKNERLVPVLSKCKEVDSWAGLRPFPKDRLPLIGASRMPGLFIAGGYYRSGILIGLYAGRLLARGIVSGKMPQELKRLDPKRFS